MPLKPSEVKIARRVAIDFLIIGMALSGKTGSAKVLKTLQPDDMVSAHGKKMLGAIHTGDRELFAAYLEQRLGVKMKPNELAVDALIRFVCDTNIEWAARESTDIIIEQVRDDAPLEDVAGALERLLSVMNQAIAAKAEEASLRESGEVMAAK